MDEGFPIPSWDAEKHIAFMDKAGIQTAVLTMPAPQPFFGNAKASAEVCRKYNEECTAKMVKSLKLIDTQPMVEMEMLGH